MYWRGWAETSLPSSSRRPCRGSELEALANQLTEAISQPYEIDGHRIRSSISIGIAVGPRDGGNAEDLLMAADLALYAVKASARGTFRFYNRSMNEGINDRRQVEMDFREAIENGELELHYQPIMDLRRDRGHRLRGARAMAASGQGNGAARRVHSGRPKTAGLVITLGRMGADGGLPHGRAMAGRPQDRRQPLARAVLDALTSTTVIRSAFWPRPVWRRTGSSWKSPSDIFMEDSEKTLSTLHRLKQLGVQHRDGRFRHRLFLAELSAQLPVTTRSRSTATFVSDLAEGTEHVVIVQAVVSIARALGHDHHRRRRRDGGQKQFLAALGCDEAQGYLFGEPVLIEKVPDVIAAWSAARTLAA